MAVKILPRARGAALLAVVTAGSIGMNGCAHRAAAIIQNDATTISGHNTAHMTPSDAHRIVLIEAAAITVDHGYRLFELATPIRPGADTIVKLYGKGEADPHAPGVYDADAIAAGNLR